MLGAPSFKVRPVNSIALSLENVPRIVSILGAPRSNEPTQFGDHVVLGCNDQCGSTSDLKRNPPLETLAIMRIIAGKKDLNDERIIRVANDVSRGAGDRLEVDLWIEHELRTEATRKVGD